MEVLPTSHSENLSLYGCYIMRVSDSALVLYSAKGDLPTQFQCDLSDVIEVHHSRVTVKGREQNILVVKTNKYVTNDKSARGVLFIISRLQI